MPWTQSQQVTLALIPKFSAVLSLMGSMAIVWECLYLDRLKLNRVYHRLLFVMSLCDILESCWNFTSTWPIPKGTPNIAFAAGNTMTCEFQGFVLQFGLATPILNMCLSIYYLLVIKFSWTEEMIKRRAEPWFHTAAFSIALGTCFACVAMDQFNNSNLWCWISPFPLGCKDSFRYGDDADCIRGDNAWIYRWAFYYVELWFAILFVAVAMSTVYITVVKLEKANKRFMSNSHRNLLKDEKAKKGKVSKSRRVAGQALWYVLAFFMTFLFSTINRLLQLVLGHTFFPLVCLHATFDPLQGFLNYLVYIRPRYLKLLEKKPDSTFWGAIRYIYERPRSDSRRKYLDYDHEEEEGAKRELARWRRRLSRSTSFINGRLSTRFLSSIQSSAVDDAQDCGDDVQNSANLVAREYYDENGDDDDPDETTQKFTNSSRHQHRSAESLRDKSKEEIFSIEIEQDFPHDEMIAPNNCSVERPRDHSDSAADNKDVRSNNTNNKGRAAQQHQQEVPSAASDDAAYELPPDEAVLSVPPSAPTNDDNDE